MEKFSIERARQGATVKTRCGFLVKTIIYDPSIDDETPVVAIVMEVVEKYGGRKRKKRFRKKLTETYPWLHEGDVLTPQYILGTDSTGQAVLDTAKQEVCHSLNRRTEFRVLRTTFGLFDANGNLIPSALVKSVQKADEEDDALKPTDDEALPADEEDVDFDY